MVSPKVSDVVDSPDRIIRGYDRIESLASKYEGESLHQAAKLYEDLVSDEPSISLYLLTDQIKNKLEGVADDQSVRDEDMAEIRKICSALEDVKHENPSQGEGRHYDLETQRKSL